MMEVDCMPKIHHLWYDFTLLGIIKRIFKRKSN